MNSEVNFEKRGRLEDHVNCPVTGWCKCCCHHCRPSKKLFVTLVFLLALFLPTLSLAQVIDYKIKVLDTPVVDLNSHGAVITDDALIQKNKKIANIICPGSDVQGIDNTVPNKLNDLRQVAGYCFQPGVGDVGFIRNRNGSYDFIHPLGSQATFLFGMNDVGMVVGQFFENGHYHGFLWDKVQYVQIDFPALNAQTALLGITNDGLIVGAYFTQDPTTNEGSEWTGFIWSNGSFFPLVSPTGGWGFPIDADAEGKILALFDADPTRGFDGGPAEPVNVARVFINDDGVFSEAALPSTVNGLNAFFSVQGMNNDGQLAGGLLLSFCANPADPATCQLFNRGFIATPKKN